MTASEGGKKLFCFTLSVLTILNGYAFFVANGVSVSMIVSTLYATYAFIFILPNIKKFQGEGKKNFSLTFLSYVLFICIMSAFSVTLCRMDYPPSSSAMLYQIAKLGVWAVFITCAGSAFFDFNIFFGYMRKIIVIAFIYILVQYFLFYVLHRNVPSAMNLGVIVPYYDSYGYDFSAESNFRPGALWVEPSFLGYYFNCFLALSFFFKGKSEKNMVNKSLYELMATIAIILSFSTGAIGIMLFIYVVKMYKTSGSHLAVLILCLLLAWLGIYLFLEYAPYEEWGNVGKVIKITLYKLNHLDKNSRTGGSFSLLGQVPPLQRFFGFGVGNITEFIKTFKGSETTYTNSLVSLILWNGFFGIAAFLVLIIAIWNNVSRSFALSFLLLLYVLGGAYSGMYYGANGILYLTIIVNAMDSETVKDGAPPGKIGNAVA